MHSICVWDIIKQSKPLQTRYETTYIYIYIYIYIRQILCKKTCICVHFSVKNAVLNYREFDLEGDLVGVPHT